MRIEFEILGMKGFNPGKINLRPRKVIEICFWEKVLTLPLIHELSQEKYEKRLFHNCRPFFWFL